MISAMDKLESAMESPAIGGLDKFGGQPTMAAGMFPVGAQSLNISTGMQPGMHADYRGPKAPTA